MSELFSALLSVAFLAQVVRITVPYALAALGGTMSERSGVINIALEGKLLVGAFSAAVGAYYGGVVAGALAGLAGGLLVAALYALCVIRFRADQIVCGVAINLLALGLTRYLLSLIFGSTANSPETPGFEVGVLANPMFWVVVLLVITTHMYLFRTATGLRVRAVGEHPEAADALGVSVIQTRWAAVLGAGALAGLGGAWMALSNAGFVAGMSGGRGYIALAAVIMGKWRPAYAAAACVLFGFSDALQVQMQASNIGVPSELADLLPYVITIVAVIGVIGLSRAPAAIGKPWDSD